MCFKTEAVDGLGCRLIHILQGWEGQGVTKCFSFVHDFKEDICVDVNI